MSTTADEGDTLERLAQLLSAPTDAMEEAAAASPFLPSAAEPLSAAASGRMSPTEAEDWAQAKQLAFADIMAMPAAQREAQVAKLSPTLSAEWALYVARHGSGDEAGGGAATSGSGAGRAVSKSDAGRHDQREAEVAKTRTASAGSGGRAQPPPPSAAIVSRLARGASGPVGEGRVTRLDSRGAQVVESPSDRSASPLQFLSRSRPSSTNATRG